MHFLPPPGQNPASAWACAAACAGAGQAGAPAAGLRQGCVPAQALDVAKQERTAASRAAQQAAATLQDLEDRAPKNEDGASLVDQQRELLAAENELERRLRPAVRAPADARRLRRTGPSAKQMVSGVGARSFRSHAKPR